MAVVSNTSPLMNLAVIGRLGLIERLYGSVNIPEAVADELAAALPEQFNEQAIKNLAVKPVLDELIATAGFWVDNHLYARVLLEAGE